MKHNQDRVARAMGKPELEADERYATQAARCARRPEVRAYIEDWLQTFADDAEPLRILAEARVPCAPILEIADVPQHEQVKARGLFQDVPHPVLGTTPVARSPFRFSTMDNRVPFRAPLLGEHNEIVLRETLGYADDRIADLYADGVLVQDASVVSLRRSGKL